MSTPHEGRHARSQANAREKAGAIQASHEGAEFSRRAQTAFADVLDAIGSAADPRSVLGAVSEIVRDLSAADLCGVALCDSDQNFHIEACAGARSTEHENASFQVGEGLIGRAIQGCVAIVSDDYTADLAVGQYLGDAASEIVPGEGLESAAATPVMVRGEALGALFVGRRAPGAFSPEFKLMLETLARQIALALDTARLLAAARDQALHAELLNAVVRKMRSQIEPRAVVEAAAGALGRGMGVTRCVILLDDEDSAGFEIAGDYHRDGLGDVSADTETLGAIGHALASAGADDSNKFVTHEIDASNGHMNIVAAPVTFGGLETGAVVICRGPADPEWGPAETRLLERAADEVGRAVGHARLFESESQAVARLRELDQMKNEFVSVVSHELRTPLTSIKGFSATLVENYDSYDTAERLRFLGIIQRQADRLGRLISDFLDVSRIQQGALTLSYDRVDLSQVATEAARDMASVAANDDREIIVTGDEPVIEADRDKVSQVISNLLSNSLKYGAGTVTIEVTETDDGAQVAVVDQGAGVAVEEADRIFDKFFQAEQGSTRRSKGVGLGLAIVKGLVEAHGGRVWYQRAEPTGARFCFFLATVVPDRIRARNARGADGRRTDLILG